MIKSIKEELAPDLSTIINQCLLAGIFPNKLKIAKVSPLFKKGDPSIPGKNHSTELAALELVVKSHQVWTMIKSP